MLRKVKNNSEIYRICSGEIIHDSNVDMLCAFTNCLRNSKELSQYTDLLRYYPEPFSIPMALDHIFTIKKIEKSTNSLVVSNILYCLHALRVINVVHIQLETVRRQKFRSNGVSSTGNSYSNGNSYSDGNSYSIGNSYSDGNISSTGYSHSNGNGSGNCYNDSYSNSPVNNKNPVYTDNNSNSFTDNNSNYYDYNTNSNSNCDDINTITNTNINTNTSTNTNIHTNTSNINTITNNNNSNSYNNSNSNKDKDNEYLQQFQELWSTYFPDHELIDKIFCDRWKLLGFQGKDPLADFRATGMLGLTQLHYFGKTRNLSARLILEYSQNNQNYFPFAATGINITELIMLMLRSLCFHKTLFIILEKQFNIETILSYDSVGPSDDKKVINSCCTVINNIYCDVFEDFYQLWVQHNAQDIMAFATIFEELKSYCYRMYQLLE